MNITVNLILLSVIFLFQSTAFADVFDYEKSVDIISKKLPKLESTNCKFTQEKIIPNSNFHIKSGGDFIFEKEKGVTFNTTYPIKSSVSYSTGEYKQINNIIKAINNNNYSKLEQNFKFYFEERNDIWHFGLKPKNNTKAADYISSVEVSGKNDILQIIIITTDETKTIINFNR